MVLKKVKLVKKKSVKKLVKKSVKKIDEKMRKDMTASQLNPSYECGEGMKVKVVKWW